MCSFLLCIVVVWAIILYLEKRELGNHIKFLENTLSNMSKRIEIDTIRDYSWHEFNANVSYGSPHGDNESTTIDDTTHNYEYTSTSSIQQ